MRKLYKVFLSEGEMLSTMRPSENEPGTWYPMVTGVDVPYPHGYVLCKTLGLLFKTFDEIYEAESDGEFVENEDVVHCCKFRLVKKIEVWDERVARLFATDCAERVLHVFESEHPKDTRLRHAISVAGFYANGSASEDELESVRMCTQHIIRSALWDQHYDREVVYAMESVLATTSISAWDTVHEAALNAALAVGQNNRVSVVEREWQTNRLMEYLYGKEGVK